MESEGQWPGTASQGPMIVIASAQRRRACPDQVSLGLIYQAQAQTGPALR